MESKGRSPSRSPTPEKKPDEPQINTNKQQEAEKEDEAKKCRHCKGEFSIQGCTALCYKAFYNNTEICINRSKCHFRHNIGVGDDLTLQIPVCNRIDPELMCVAASQSVSHTDRTVTVTLNEDQVERLFQIPVHLDLASVRRDPTLPITFPLAFVQIGTL